MRLKTPKEQYILDARNSLLQSETRYRALLKQTEETVRAGKARLELLSGVAARLLATDNPQTLVNELCTSVIAHLDCQLFFNYLVDPTTGRLHLNAAAGISPAQMRKIAWLDIGSGFCGSVARNGCSIVADDVQHSTDPRTAQVHDYGLQAYACFPLLAGKRLLGTLSFGTTTRTAFTPDEIACMKTVSDHVAIAIARIQAEAELLKAGALQKAIFNSANFSSIATDEKGVIQVFNVGAERMLGYAAIEVVDKVTPAEISDPQEVIARAEALSLELATPITPGFEALVFKARRGIEDIYELTYIRKDGSRFPAVVSVTALRDEADEVIGYLLIGTDNTARKQAEAELLEAGALQQAIFNSANFSSIATDEKGVIQVFNVGAEVMLGYTADEVVNKITPAEISDPEEVIARAEALSLELATPITPGFEALVFKARRGIEDIYELTYIRKDGSRFPAVVSVTALRDEHGAVIGYLLIGTDNTARKQAQAALLASEARFRAAFESAAIGIEELDLQGNFLLGNAKLAEIQGRSLDEIRNLTFEHITHPDDLTRERPLIAQLLAGKIPSYTIEKRYLHKDGHPVWLRVTSSLTPGNPTRSRISIIEDITERKEMEEALRQTAAELTRSNKELEQFAYVASHDLQEPLRAVSGYVSLVEEHLSEHLDPKVLKYIRGAMQGAERMQTLITDLLALSRLGTRGEPFAPVDFNALLAQVVQSISASVEENDARISADPLPTLLADAGQMGQLLQNLLLNAIKFRGEQPPHIHLGAERKDDCWQFSVHDNGIGIEPRFFERIFLIFQRLHTRTQYPGTGIGLAICQKIIERHGGKIWVESQPGDGSTFFFTLPTKGVEGA